VIKSDSLFDDLAQLIKHRFSSEPWQPPWMRRGELPT
jgi:hypothetical protein